MANFPYEYSPPDPASLALAALLFPLLSSSLIRAYSYIIQHARYIANIPPVMRYFVYFSIFTYLQYRLCNQGTCNGDLHGLPCSPLLISTRPEHLCDSQGGSLSQFLSLWCFAPPFSFLSFILSLCLYTTLLAISRSFPFLSFHLVSLLSFRALTPTIT